MPTARMERRRSFAWRVRPYVISSVVALIALEIVSRVFVSSTLECTIASRDRALLYTLRPGAYDYDGWLLRMPESRIHIDPDGCRRVPHLEDSPVPRVLFVGDSMTLGLGVGDEDALPAQVERALAARAHPAEALNCGVLGYNLTQSIRAAEIRASSQRPRVIVLVVHPSDLEAPFDLASFGPTAPWSRHLTRWSRLARVVAILHGLVTLDRPPELSVPEIERALDRLERAARANDAQLLVLEIGNAHHSQASFGELLDRRSIAHDTLPSLPRTPEMFLPDDEHWTAEGTRRIAAHVAPLVEAALARE